MPKDFASETAVTIDHERGVMWVDTTRAGIVTELLRAGFAELTGTTNRPYRRFRGEADQLRFRKPKGQRKVRGIAKTLLQSHSEKRRAV